MKTSRVVEAPCSQGFGFVVQDLRLVGRVSVFRVEVNRA